MNDMSPIGGIAIALVALRDWTRGLNNDRPTRAQLRGWVTLVLRDYARRGLRLAEVERTHAEDVARLGDERDELRRTLRKAHAERDGWKETASHEVRKVVALRAELADARDHATARGQFIADRLAVSAACEHGVTVTVTPKGGA